MKVGFMTLEKDDLPAEIVKIERRRMRRRERCIIVNERGFIRGGGRADVWDDGICEIVLINVH